MQNKLHTFNHFGEMTQKHKLFEENMELQNALYNWSANPTRENCIKLIDEWNDTGALIKQFAAAKHSIPEEEIQAMARDKEQRTLEIISKCDPSKDKIEEYNKYRRML